MASRHQANFTGVRPPGQHFSIVHVVVIVVWAVVWWGMLCRLVPAVDSCVTPGQSSSFWGFDYNTCKRNRLDMKSAGSWHVFLLILSYRLYCLHRNLINFAGWLKGAVLSSIWTTIPWIRLRTSSFWTKFHFECVMSARFSFCETQKRGIHRSSSSLCTLTTGFYVQKTHILIFF